MPASSTSTSTSTSSSSSSSLLPPASSAVTAAAAAGSAPSEGAASSSLVVTAAAAASSTATAADAPPHQQPSTPAVALLASTVDELLASLDRFSASWNTTNTDATAAAPASSLPGAAAGPDQPPLALLAASSTTTTGSCLQQVISLNDRLAAALDDVDSHQQFQRRILETERETVQCNVGIMDLLHRLRNAERMLEDLLSEVHLRRSKMQQAKSGTTNYREIIGYAHRLAKYTSPPLAGMPIMYPPVPQDSHMKRSLLFQQEAATADAQAEAETELNPRMLMEIDVLARLVQPQQFADAQPQHLDLDLEF
ncbi:vitamin-D-receptor interacting mediator subunit 4-domain-containing protein [Zopfochytrium polystomum]|nr:vitamin-D-receptor interacting mediator subunit 4-domain-containing protein [Zopfochytrium polystomum]